MAAAVEKCREKIVKTNFAVKGLIQDIREDVKSLDELNLKNLNVKTKILELQDLFDDLENHANEQDKEFDKRELIMEVDNHRLLFEGTQSLLRKANLSCQFSLDRMARDALFSEDGRLRQRNIGNNKQQLAKTSMAVTENLREISQQMAQQVIRSEDAMDHLVSSSDALKDAGEEFTGLTSWIKVSRNLITKYGRRELTDKVLLALALAFFLGVVAYIVKKRLFPNW